MEILKVNIILLKHNTNKKQHNKQQKLSHNQRNYGGGTFTTNHTNWASERQDVFHVQHDRHQQKCDLAIKAPKFNVKSWNAKT